MMEILKLLLMLLGEFSFLYHHPCHSVMAVRIVSSRFEADE